MKKIISVWVLKAIVKNKEVGFYRYALEYSHLPHATFSENDWSGETSEEVALYDFYHDDPEVKEAIETSRKYLQEQIERHSHLLEPSEDYEKLTDFIYRRRRHNQ